MKLGEKLERLIWDGMKQGDTVRLWVAPGVFENTFKVGHKVF